MNFWTPTFHSWGKGLDPVDMPWYLLFDYVEVYTWDPATEDFVFHWRDDFNSFDVGRWHRASGSFAANSSTFHPANAYTEDGALVLKMEPDGEVVEVQETFEHGHEYGDRHYTRYDGLDKQMVKQKLNLHDKQQADAIDIPPVHDAFVDEHLFTKHDERQKAVLTETYDEVALDKHDLKHL